jgi:allophanate hydrolase
MRRAVPSLKLGSLRLALERGELTPSDVINCIYDRIEAAPDSSIWIACVPREAALARVEALEHAKTASELPLFGIPFAVKDNIDVAGLPTTAALPEPVRVPAHSAPVVERLLAAGAVFIGKTNLDQLACGLTGVRSPYGIPRNPFNPAYIPGGSSSGSAAAVSHNLVSFALGTDTAGSGRVPAAFNNLVGLKPSPGLLSTSGVLPACRSLDCVSVFAHSVADATRIAELIRGFDPSDPRSRRESDHVSFFGAPEPAQIRFGVPRANQLEFFGDQLARLAFDQAIAHLIEVGGERVDIDFAPFAEAGELLYGGPWVAERTSMLHELPEQATLLPVIREIFAEASRYDACATFRAWHRLTELVRIVEHYWHDIDVLLVPTTPTIYTLAQVQAEPRALNARLGMYTNFVNLLGLAAIAVPNGFRPDGLPTGVTLIGPRDSDARLALTAQRFTGVEAESADELAPAHASVGAARLTRLAVVGAHLSGQPLNSQLTTLDAKLVKTCRTAPHYRCYALPSGKVRKPGLVRTGDNQGYAIEVEIWEMSQAALGAFMHQVAPPLCIGTLLLDDGSAVLGFLCEPYAVSSAQDISEYGGWRAYLRQLT